MLSNQKTILVAEDEDINFLYIKEVLKILGVNVLHARNGVEAVSFCKNDNSIELVLMDIKMPIMNGYEATKEIRKFKPNLIIIAQTAFALLEDRKRTLECGCNDYISKPFTREALINIMKKYLNG
jgi:two-component system, cell cycle response regulator DivK